MKNTRYHYISSLQAEELKSIVSKQKTKWFCNGICGKSYGNKIKIYYKDSNRNSWNPVFYGIISEHTQGTLICGNFQTQFFVKAFIWVWRGFVIFAFLFLLSLFLFNNTDYGSVVSLLVPTAMLIFSFVLERIGEKMGEKSKDKIFRFLKEKLFAKPYEKTEL